MDLQLDRRVLRPDAYPDLPDCCAGTNPNCPSLQGFAGALDVLWMALPGHELNDER
jgi:hypothetical protein